MIGLVDHLVLAEVLGGVAQHDLTCLQDIPPLGDLQGETGILPTSRMVCRLQGAAIPSRVTFQTAR